MKYSWLIVATLATILGSSARAEDSTQPYIDQLKKSLPPQEDSEGYTDRLRGKLPPSQDSEGYTEQLRQANPALQLQGTPEPSYSEEKKSKLPPKETGGAIAAFERGESDLKKVKSTDIHNAIGIRIGMIVSRNYAANFGIGTGRAFSDVYGSGYAPDISVFAEHQFFHSESFGSLGVFGMFGLAYFSGPGAFAIPLSSAYNNTPIPATATGVTERFWQAPGTVGASLRLNVGKYIRPYVMAGPTIIGAEEFRSDGGNTNRALSYGFWGAAGVAILMDWVSKDVDWDSYADYGIKHTYFTFEFAGTACFPPSAVNFNASGLVGGIAFEY